MVYSVIEASAQKRYPATSTGIEATKAYAKVSVAVPDAYPSYMIVHFDTNKLTVVEKNNGWQRTRSV